MRGSACKRRVFEVLIYFGAMLIFLKKAAPFSELLRKKN